MPQPFLHTNQVSFELSNVCNLASAHSLCPLHSGKVGGAGKTLLPARIFIDSINLMADYGFHGLVCFSIYNEPTNDPRLVDFIKYTKSKLHERGRTFVISNSTYLDEGLILELSKSGLDILWISAYKQVDFDYFTNVKAPDSLQYLVFPGRHDDRNTIYTNDIIGLSQPCSAPLGNISIRCNGDVVLCCMDWASTNIFGNLKDQSLVDIISTEEVQTIYKELSTGNRNCLDICSHCKYTYF